ncbi:hypothetical protein GOC46_00005, partial [Sinorhizobium meliloti]|nr:hypothetical protein [Sinorhizobium meliloti]MDX0378613.1 hypothetical protein [Sinorhizobium meliloti]
MALELTFGDEASIRVAAYCLAASNFKFSNESADSDEAAPLFRDDCAPGFRDDLAPC